MAGSNVSFMEVPLLTLHYYSLEGQDNLKEKPLLQELFLLRRNFVLGYCRPLSKWFLKEGLLQKCLEHVALGNDGAVIQLVFEMIVLV